MSQGVFPLERHDFTQFTSPSDDYRIERKGRTLIKGCLLLIKGDWDAFANVLGFPPWNSKRNPCIFCNCTQAHMHDYKCLEGGDELPWSTHDDESYRKACEDCEIWVQIDDARMRDKIVAALHYDKRKQGFKGRALLQDLDLGNGTTLLKGRCAHERKETCNNSDAEVAFSFVFMIYRIFVKRCVFYVLYVGGWVGGGCIKLHGSSNLVSSRPCTRSGNLPRLVCRPISRVLFTL